MQAALFPSGVMASSEEFGTPKPTFIFKELEVLVEAKELASRGGFEPPSPYCLVTLGSK